MPTILKTCKIQKKHVKMTPTASANCSLPMLMQFLENGLCSENILSLNFIRVVKKKNIAQLLFSHSSK